MKKSVSKFIAATALVFGLILSVALVGCGGVKEIALDTSAVATVFEVGTEFDSDNLVVYAKNGGTNERIKKDEYTVSAPDMSEAGKKTVTVTYGEITATYEIEVVVKAVVATFTGDVSFGLGGGRVMDFASEFKCYNTLEWEIVGAGGIYSDSGKYTVKDGVYTMTMSSGSNISTTVDADGKVTIGYEGFGIKLMGGMLTANGHGILTLQE